MNYYWIIWNLPIKPYLNLIKPYELTIESYEIYQLNHINPY